MTVDEITPVGDAACWLRLVCDACGALTEGDADACWRCDTPLAPAG